MAVYSALSPVQPISNIYKIPPKVFTSPPKTAYSSSSMFDENCESLFGPAIDRPPSPERIRQVNRQMKESYLQKHGNGNHQVAYSASSSLSSISSESAGWEPSSDAPIGLRRPLGLSADRLPNRDRDESAASFSRSLLHRRRGSRRENSVASSATSSLYSMESAENGPLNVKDSLMPSLFSRRKPSRDEANLRRFQISNPFNFKHVLHTDRESVSRIQVTKPSNLLAMKATGPSSDRGEANGLEIIISEDTISAGKEEDVKEERGTDGDEEEALRDQASPVHDHITPMLGPDQLMRRIRSHEQMRVTPLSLPSSPPRPPRSPTSTSVSSLLPIPPPRVSSRQAQAAYRNFGERYAGPSLVRPKTSGGFRRPQPYNPAHYLHNPMPLPVSIHLPLTSAKPHDADARDFAASSITFSASQAPWPFIGHGTAPFESPLPDVPEEEEQHQHQHQHQQQQRQPNEQCRSSPPSLKSCHSVPMLRVMAKSHRPLSGASETLGHFDLTATHVHVPEGADERHAFQFGIIEDNWEDDIDYCYEHEAEASCDYQWERASLDTARSVNMLGDYLAIDQTHAAIGTAHSSPGLLPVGGLGLDDLPQEDLHLSARLVDMPSTWSKPGGPGNFSLPRAGRMQIRASHASSFKESHGFTLSPSLLIPDELHHQLLLERGVRDSLTDEEELMGSDATVGSHVDECSSSLGSKLSQWLHQRSSTSTTDTSFTSRTGSSGDRHHSANSSWSVLTRPATSGPSVGKSAGEGVESVAAVYGRQQQQQQQPQQQREAFAFRVGDVVPELIPCGTLSGKMGYHKTHASESIIRREVLPSAHGLDRRVRTRTTSMSTQLPPVGQYSLFPRSNIRPMGDQI